MSVKSLFVGNLPYSATEEDVRELFEAYGPIDDVRLISTKGVAFVDLPSENAQAAIEAVHGSELGGRTLTVNEARPRPERRAGGGGGYRGGGGRPRGGGRRW